MTHPMAAMRGEHRPGTDDMATAVALLRAATDEDPDAMIGLLRGLSSEDDMRGIITYLAIVGAKALVNGEGVDGAHASLDLMAALERG